MRRKITLDPDVDAAIRRLMRERGLTFEEAVNTAIRLGLTGPEEGGAFSFPTYRMGPAKVRLDKASSISAHLEDEELLRR